MESRKRIIGLDLIRFLAALGIMAYHYLFIGVLQSFYAEEVFLPLAFWGEFGVDIFFILSGFSILFSTESRKAPIEFLKGRIKRIYPAFIICSVITMLTGMIMPGTYKSDLLFRWVNSLTLCNDIWGVQPLSSIYWTLMVEMKFYILTAVILKLGIWTKHKYHILFIWISVSLLNTLSFRWTWLEILFNTKYAGHFAVGIVLYLRHKGYQHTWMVPILGGGIWCVYRNFIGYTQWIRGIYDGLHYSDVDIFCAVIFIIAIVYLSSNIYGRNDFMNRVVLVLGAWSYTIYLIHADFGYFIRTQYYYRLIIWMPWLSRIVNEYVIMIIAAGASLLLSYIILRFVNWLMKREEQ